MLANHLRAELKDKNNLQGVKFVVLSKLVSRAELLESPRRELQEPLEDGRAHGPDVGEQGRALLLHQDLWSLARIQENDVFWNKTN